ncbi:MAG: histidine phosphatase family protein [Muribaculaceae bacterium]|nr:histidine phosphatase family protein [Muribaculaceae bacterium]
MFKRIATTLFALSLILNAGTFDIRSEKRTINASQRLTKIENVKAEWSGREVYKPLPKEFSGSMMPYDFSLCDTVVAWDNSLQPVFVSYVARHGARYLTSPKKIEMIADALNEAEGKGMLSAEGLEMLRFIREISQKSEGKWGLLSSVGVEEEETLGKDMAKMLPKLFKRGEAVAESTYVPRVIMTMYQFMHALEIPNQRLELYASSGHQYDSLLRCFSKNKEYSAYRDKGEWQNAYDEFVQRHVSSDPARRLFAEGYKEDRPELRNLTMSLYGLIQSLEASGLAKATTKFMSEQEYQGCWLASNLQHYLRNNINMVSAVAGTATAPLLDRIMKDADTALSSGNCKLRGYFGHAETVLPLYSLMNLPGCSLMTDDYDKLADVWRVQDIAPLGANLAIILLKGKKGEIYASLRLNGRNIKPLPGKGEIVKWTDLKKYWSERIEEFSDKR